VVVGASSSIGRAVAVTLADLGYAPGLWGRSIEGLEETARRCASVGAVGAVRILDVTDRDAVRAAVGESAPEGRLHAAVWCAGLFDWGPADRADPEAWARLIDVNLTAAASFTAMVLPALIQAAPSALVLIGSGAGHQAFPDNAAYVASKHGLTGLAGATFLDVRDRGVKVTLVSPGLVAAGAGLRSRAGTEHPDLLLQPDDVASAVRFAVTFPTNGCPTEIRLQPQQTPQS
jgi:NADP-dependent 3-hydroxy acid dehydrogenase YdfG